MIVRRSPITRWIFDEYRIGYNSLGISRILLSLSLLVLWYNADNPRYLWMANFPGSFYAPPPLSLGIIFLSTHPGS